MAEEDGDDKRFAPVLNELQALCTASNAQRLGQAKANLRQKRGVSGGSSEHRAVRLQQETAQQSLVLQKAVKALTTNDQQQLLVYVRNRKPTQLSTLEAVLSSTHAAPAAAAVDQKQAARVDEPIDRHQCCVARQHPDHGCVKAEVCYTHDTYRTKEELLVEIRSTWSRLNNKHYPLNALGCPREWQPWLAKQLGEEKYLVQTDTLNDSAVLIRSRHGCAPPKPQKHQRKLKPAAAAVPPQQRQQRQQPQREEEEQHQKRVVNSPAAMDRVDLSQLPGRPAGPLPPVLEEQMLRLMRQYPWLEQAAMQSMSKIVGSSSSLEAQQQAAATCHHVNMAAQGLPPLAPEEWLTRV